MSLNNTMTVVINRSYAIKYFDKCSVLIILMTLAFTQNGFAQKYKPFNGMLEYKITSRDTSLQSILPNNSMFIYTNDTIVRTENFTSQLGKQVVIRHIEKNKSYLLLETQLGKFAIQTDHSISDTIVRERKYTFKKKMFKRKILGRKANRMIVSHPEFEQPIEFWYLKKYSHKYTDLFEEIPGIPVKYSIPTADGVLDYELVKISEYAPDNDLFGIPTEYERISFDDFLDKMLAPENEKIISPE